MGGCDRRLIAILDDEGCCAYRGFLVVEVDRAKAQQAAEAGGTSRVVGEFQEHIPEAAVVGDRSEVATRGQRLRL